MWVGSFCSWFMNLSVMLAVDHMQHTSSYKIFEQSHTRYVWYILQHITPNVGKYLKPMQHFGMVAICSIEVDLLSVQ